MNDHLQAYTDVHDKKVWDLCFTVPGVSLPTGYYFGASALTGDLSDNHDIVSVKMFELDIPRSHAAPKFGEVVSGQTATEEDRSNIVPKAQNYAAPRDHIPDVGASGLKRTILAVFALAGAGTAVVCGVLWL